MSTNSQDFASNGNEQSSFHNDGHVAMLLRTSGSEKPEHVAGDLGVAEALVPSEHSHSPRHSATASNSDDASGKEKVTNRDSTTTSSTSSVHDGYDPTKTYDLPPPIGPRWYRFLRWRVFSVYRKIYLAVFLLNLIWGLVGYSLFDYGASIYASGSLLSDSLATPVAANLMVAIVIRNEHVINALFSTCIATPHWTPLWLRTSVAMIYSYGGLHSGCTTASTIWYALYTTATIREHTVLALTPTPLFLILAVLLLTLLLTILALAFPALRARHHNHFELTHRYLGWTALALIWAQLISAAILSSRPTARTFFSTPAVWLLLVTTLFVAYPWLRLRRVPVVLTPLSPHALRVTFPNQPAPRLCSAVRISDRPWRENHSFATFPAGGGEGEGAGVVQGQREQRSSTRATKPGFSILIAPAGDWTTRLITQSPPPTSLHLRSGPAQGMAAIAALFRPVVLVATGAGIAPCLDLCATHPRVRIIWSARAPERSFGTEVVGAVKRADGQAVVVDTERVPRGDRPDLVRLAWGVRGEVGAEAVVVVGNKRIVDYVVGGLVQRGVPAFGPIWDS